MSFVPIASSPGVRGAWWCANRASAKHLKQLSTQDGPQTDAVSVLVSLHMRGTDVIYNDRVNALSWLSIFDLCNLLVTSLLYRCKWLDCLFAAFKLRNETSTRNSCAWCSCEGYWDRPTLHFRRFYVGLNIVVNVIPRFLHNIPYCLKLNNINYLNFV